MKPTLIALAASALLLAGSAPPALSAAAEDAFLLKLVGTWSGRGTINGDKTGAVDCNMSVRTRSDGIGFRGKCDTGEFGPQNFSGTVSYNDAAGQYEAISNTGDITVGKKSGKGVVFIIKLKSAMASGQSVMTLTASRVSVETDVTFSGDKLTSHIELSK